VGRTKRSGADAEGDVVRALRGQLRTDEILLSGVRITDPREGDVEVDIVVLFPDLGAAVVEVKGGDVRQVDGHWTTGGRTSRRRINPIEQARRAKHALRRYLDRQPEWQRPLLRTEWFVAMPQTEVTGDLGPEGQRDHLLGSGDLGAIRDRIRAVLFSPLNTDPIPTAGWEHDALTLLMRSSHSARVAPTRRGRGALIPVAAVLAAVAVAAPLAWWWSARGGDEPGQGVPPAITGECHPDYEPCLPVKDDLNCGDVQMVVTVRSEDPYGLDRDGDGVACEGYAK
jgi:hypothetical protein